MCRIVGGLGDDLVMDLEQIIDTEHRFPRHSNRKTEYLRRVHKTTALRYYTALNAAIDDGSMERIDPVLAHHLEGLRWRRGQARLARRRVRSA